MYIRNGKKYHDQRLVELIVNKDHTLTIKKRSYGHAKDFNDIQAMNISDDNKLGEALEYYTCNGWGYSSDASSFGHLSNAPIVWDGNDVVETEDGDEYPVKFWYDDMYAIRSAWGVLMQDGSVTFSYFN